METPFLVVIVVLGAALVVLGAVVLNVVSSLKATITRLEKRVEGLQSELAHQQSNLQAIQAVLHNKPEDPFQAVLQGFDRYRSRGLLPAVAWIGVRLFKSYLNGRARNKALPMLDKSAEKK